MPNTHTNHYAYLSEQIIELIMSNNQDFLNIFIEKILHILPRLANGSLTLSHDGSLTTPHDASLPTPHDASLPTHHDASLPTHHDRPTQQNHHTST